MDFIAKPNVVRARRITGFEPIEVRGVLDFIGNAGLWLHLDDDAKYKATPSQLALFTPQPGDYLVQDVDFEFILPRVVFERNFGSADEFKLTAAAPEAQTQSTLPAVEA